MEARFITNHENAPANVPTSQSNGENDKDPYWSTPIAKENLQTANEPGRWVQCHQVLKKRQLNHNANLYTLENTQNIRVGSAGSSEDGVTDALLTQGWDSMVPESIWHCFMKLNPSFHT